MPRKKSEHDIEFDVWVGRAIEELRKDAGLSQKELARRTRLTQQQLSWYEAGRSSCPLSTLVKIAAAIGAPISQFIPNTSCCC